VKRIEIQLSSLKDTQPHEYAMRFLFGGLATVVAGLIAQRFGPAVGGLFLAFPAIFPAGASLIEAHEKRRKAKLGSDGRNRGRMAASLDSKGAALGSVGLVSFGFILWRRLTEHNAVAMIALAAGLWLLVSYVLWAIGANRLRKRLARL
jgi:Protein of unknown function (DUF3147)